METIIKEWIEAGHKALTAQLEATKKRDALIAALTASDDMPSVIEFEPGKVLHWFYPHDDARFPTLDVLSMQRLD